MKKNNFIKLVDVNNEQLGVTTSEIAKKLIKEKRAKFVEDDKLCLLFENVKKKELKPNKGLNKIKIPKYSLSEELMSAISHGLGVAVSIAILILCIIRSVLHEDPYAVVASTLYGSTSIVLYMMSTLYHSFKVNRAKKVFRIIDHCSIYLLIAGTYTPYALVSLRSVSPALGWSVFGVIWACAIVGITFTAIDMNKFKKMGMLLYIIMGWMIVFTFKTLLSAVPVKGIYYMIAAGIIYTIGAILYGVGKKVKYMHSVFHVFVLIASLLFFFSIFFYVI